MTPPFGSTPADLEAFKLMLISMAELLPARGRPLNSNGYIRQSQTAQYEANKFYQRGHDEKVARALGLQKARETGRQGKANTDRASCIVAHSDVLVGAGLDATPQNHRYEGYDPDADVTGDFGVEVKDPATFIAFVDRIKQQGIDPEVAEGIARIVLNSAVLTKTEVVKGKTPSPLHGAILLDAGDLAAMLVQIGKADSPACRMMRLFAEHNSSLDLREVLIADEIGIFEPVGSDESPSTWHRGTGSDSYKWSEVIRMLKVSLDNPVGAETAELLMTKARGHLDFALAELAQQKGSTFQLNTLTTVGLELDLLIRPDLPPPGDAGTMGPSL